MALHINATLQGACVASGQFLSEVDVNEETVTELLRCYISASDNNLKEVSYQLFVVLIVECRPTISSLKGLSIVIPFFRIHL